MLEIEILVISYSRI